MATRKRKDEPVAHVEPVPDPSAILAAVGTVPTQHLAWLVAFAGRELSGEPERVRAFHECIFFCRQYSAHKAGAVTAGGLQCDRIEDAQAVARRFVEHLDDRHPHFDGRPLPVVFEEYPVRVSFRLDKVGSVPTITSTTTAGTFTAALSNFLAQVGPRLRRCAASNCPTVFVAVRNKQVYCSIRCQNRASAAQYRAAHAEELAEQRHEKRKERIVREYAEITGVPIERVRVAPARREKGRAL